MPPQFPPPPQFKPQQFPPPPGWITFTFLIFCQMHDYGLLFSSKLIRNIRFKLNFKGMQAPPPGIQAQPPAPGAPAINPARMAQMQAGGALQ
jgi:hypothetical protein